MENDSGSNTVLEVMSAEWISGTLILVRSKLLSLIGCVLIATTVLANEGTYRASNGMSYPWRVNEHHTLIWNGEVFLPFGIRQSSDLAQLSVAQKAGIRDIVVELPASGLGWKEAIQKLESAQVRYLIAVTSMSPPSTGYQIDPSGYRFPGLTAEQQIKFTLNGSNTALSVLALRSDNTVQKIERTPVNQNQYQLLAQPPNDLEHVLYVYPRTESGANIDYWAGMDKQRDQLLIALKNAKLGAGFRGLLNPMGEVINLQINRSFVPDSDLFRYEFVAYLQQRYRNLNTLSRAWNIGTHDLDSFQSFARLVPLWNGVRGVALLWDPKTDSTYNCEIRRSTIWDDIETVIRQAQMRRLTRLVSAIRQIADVPILQEWNGWSGIYEVENPVLNGLAAKSSGATMTEFADTTGRAVSSILRWRKNGWMINSEIDVNVPPNTPPANLPALCDDAISMGSRGAYFRLSENAQIEQIAAELQKRVVDPSPSQWSPTPLFFPENAFYPAWIQRLPGGRWWFPAPISGNRLDYGTKLTGYRLDDGERSYYAIWLRSGSERIRLRFADLKKPTFSTLDGTDPKPRIVRNWIEVNANEYPLIITGTDEIPVPQASYDEFFARFAAITKAAESRREDISSAVFRFNEAIAGFDRNPGGAYTLMLEQYQRAAVRLARYNWIEAESTREHVFSEVTKTPGASGGSVLTLNTQVIGGFSTYRAEYTVVPKSEQDMDVWIAARIDKGSQKSVTINANGQILEIQSEAINPYGSGFAWYRMGTTRFVSGQNKITLEVVAPEGIQMAVDTILIHPGGFRPRGPFIPDPIPFDSITSGGR